MEKEDLVRSFMGPGLNRDNCLEIVGLSRNQLYCKLKGNKLGRAVSTTTIWREHSGTHGIPPAKFWALHDLSKIDIIPLDKNKARIQLKVAYQDILTLPGFFKYQYRAHRA